MDTLKILDHLESLVEEARSFMGFRRFDDEEFFMLVSKLRASLPEDVRRAGKITKESERIVEAAQSEAENAVEKGRSEAAQVMQEARARAQAMVEQSEIMRMAKVQAKEIVAQAEGEAREVRQGADEYARDVLSTLESQVNEVLTQTQGKVTGMLQTIQRGRQKLEQRAARPGAPAAERREPIEVGVARTANGTHGSRG
uniref:ATPase n=1 Tax=uncultured Armatimonadetes bacterium TaxID=157466 RepID=A0A6J4JST2_9BACT|nr:hypothetical protein AVDCRST_MAG63-4013 [uncultured Armatimonadetes bacterium]